MKHRIAISCVIVAATLVPLASHAATCTPITRTLKQGMSGDDVKAAQAYLNSSADTTIASSGNNSPGNETGTFDANTKTAVEKLQSAHADAILAPAGLTAPTGIVGAATRTVINSTICPAQPVMTTPLEQLHSDPRYIALMQNLKKASSQYKSLDQETADRAAAKAATDISAYQRIVDALTRAVQNSTKPIPPSVTVDAAFPPLASPGAPVYVIGAGLSRDGGIIDIPKLMINGRSVLAAQVMANGTLAQFILPSDTESGNLTSSIVNTIGTSNLFSIPIGATANGTIALPTPPATRAPTITAVSPTSGSIGTVVTITGTGFLSTNSVFTTTARLDNITSTDGKTLTVTLATAPEIIPATGALAKTIPFFIMVRNANGTSNPIQFTLK